MTRFHSYLFVRPREIFFLLALVLIFTACGKDEQLPDFAYLSGQIVNPNTDYVILLRNGELLDTIKINDKNRFTYKINNVDSGIYMLQHPPKKQILYLTPGDSLLFRANTLAFDESLHFSGTGNERNNFMANMFLKDENTAQLLLSFKDYSPNNFEAKADSIKQERLDNLNRVGEKEDFSKEFIKQAEKIIFYENYDLRERYVYLVQRYYPEYSQKLSSNFFKYREKADFNDSSIWYSPSYRRFINTYLVNYSLSTSEEIPGGQDLTSFDNVSTRLQKVDELIKLPELREYFLEKIAVRGLVMARNREEILDILKLLKSLEMPEETLDEMKQLGSVQLGFLPGTSLAEAPLLNMKGENITLQQAVRRPSVIFIWSAYSQDHIEEHRLIREYKEKYPEIDFIGVNVDTNEEPLWRMAVRENNYPPGKEYQLRETGIKKKFLQYYLDKLIFITPKGEVVKGDTYLQANDFESHLLKFLNT